MMHLKITWTQVQVSHTHTPMIKNSAMLLSFFIVFHMKSPGKITYYVPKASCYMRATAKLVTFPTDVHSLKTISQNIRNKVCRTKKKQNQKLSSAYKFRDAGGTVIRRLAV